ncbi:hypothetical protein LR48_Vigan04g151300 [Vigna angularis]|uniref:PUB domain-containing protein n=1 Tax=Phaseolus angularis TaxID=3914 RepID=A0A0L9UEF4_PHAAN|nr:hypothetical protein LR48_Vigan04g151300 [Vigna angularis]
MKLQDWVRRKKVMILIDSGASHNFIATELVEELGLPVEETPSYRVSLGDGRKKQTRGCCRDVLLNRKFKQGLPLEGQGTIKSSATKLQKEKKLNPVYTTTKTEQLRECLRNLKRNHQGEDARVRRAFQTLLIYVGNVAKNPKEEKYRKIRLNNPLFLGEEGCVCGSEEGEGARGGIVVVLVRENVHLKLGEDGVVEGVNLFCIAQVGPLGLDSTPLARVL